MQVICFWQKAPPEGPQGRKEGVLVSSGAAGVDIVPPSLSPT